MRDWLQTFNLLLEGDGSSSTNLVGLIAIAQQLSRIADTLDRISRDYREDLFSRHAHLSITRGRKKRL